MDTVVDGETVKQLEAPAAKTGIGRRTVLLGIGAVLLIAGVVWGVRWWTVGRFI
jgi:membrane fusion protein (multidrug efflux system)